MKIIVGLGNPGKQYNQTRHNVGFDVLTCIAQRYAVGRPKAKFNAEVAETRIKNEKAVLISPLTFMNLSGQSVRAAIDFYKIELSDLLIVCDDINLDVGRIRFRPSGSAGGQNGLKDIINRLGSDQFSRLRVGVGRVLPQWDTSNFVLGKFDDQDRPTIDKTIIQCADAVDVWVESGVQTAMNRFNADPSKKPKPKSPRPARQQPSNRENGESSGDSGSKEINSEAVQKNVDEIDLDKNNTN